MNLQTVFNNHTDRYSAKWEHYFEVYDRYLQRFIGKEFTLLEIGVSNGGSLQIWKKYFGDKVKIVGVDIDPRTMYTEDQIETFCGSQSDPKFLESVIQKVGAPDVIIDDGSHDQMDVLNTLGMLFPVLKEGGVYVVEDMHTAYMHEWHGGLTSPLNFVTFASKFAHDVNTVWMKQPYTPFVQDLKSVSFHDSMVIMEKGKAYKKTPAFTGTVKIPGV